MVDQSIVDEWLAKADEDYLFTEKYLQNEESFFAPLCFHCQQAAEKYLKAYIVAKDLSFQKIHDINELRDDLLVDYAGGEMIGIEVLDISSKVAKKDITSLTLSMPATYAV